MVKEVIAFIVATAVGIIANLLASWLEPTLAQWKRLTIAAFVSLILATVFFLLPGTSNSSTSDNDAKAANKTEARRDSLPTSPATLTVRDTANSVVPIRLTGRIEKFIDHGQYGFKIDTHILIMAQYDMAGFMDEKKLLYLKMGGHLW